jgi:sugar lactone lactonase YvrE
MGSRSKFAPPPQTWVATGLLILCCTAVSLADVTTVAVVNTESESPGGISVDVNGNVYSADFGGTGVFKIEPDGSTSVFATGFLTPSGNGFDSKGNFYQSNYSDPVSPLSPDTIVKITPDGARTIFATGLDGPVGITFDASDTMYVAMCNLQNVTRIDQSGVASVFATDPGFACPNGITFDTKGNLYTCNFNDGGVYKIAPDGSVSLFATLPGGGNGHLTYVAGWLYIADRAGNQIYRLHVKTRVLELAAGTGEVGSQVDGPEHPKALLLPHLWDSLDGGN